MDVAGIQERFRLDHAFGNAAFVQHFRPSCRYDHAPREDADLKRLDLDERRGVLIRVAKVEDAIVAAGEKIVRIIDQLPMDYLATAVAKGGVQALRMALKEIARRTGIAASVSLGDE